MKTLQSFKILRFVYHIYRWHFKILFYDVFILPTIHTDILVLKCCLVKIKYRQKVVKFQWDSEDTQGCFLFSGLIYKQDKNTLSYKLTTVVDARNCKGSWSWENAWLSHTRISARGNTGFFYFVYPPTQFKQLTRIRSFKSTSFKMFKRQSSCSTFNISIIIFIFTINIYKHTPMSF